MRWGFEDFTLDSEAFELRKGDQPLAAEPQVLSLLILLVENAGRLLSKDEIIDAIWDGRAISDAALSSRVKSARQLIGDNGKEQRLIKTVYGNGLRFVGSVEQEIATVELPAEGGNPAPTAASIADRFRLGAGIVAIMLAIGLMTLIWLYLDSKNSESGDRGGEIVVAVLPLTASSEQSLGDELASIIVTRLSDRSDYTMLSSTSSFSLAEQGSTAAHIAERLGATHVLEGELRRSGNVVSVDLRLIEGRNQKQIWSHTVQEDAANKKQLMDKVVRHSSAAIQTHLEVGAGQVDIPEGTSSEAIRDFRNALESDLAYYRRQTELDRHLSFDSARQKAPNWADAHGAFAWSTLFTRPETIALEHGEQLELVRDAIAQAKKIDPKNRWGRLAEGVYQTRYGNDFATALEMLEALVTDEPDWPIARRMYAQALLVGGHYRDAVVQYEQIDALNSLPTWLDGFIRAHALRGIGKPMDNATLAQNCEAQCYWIYSGWYEAILLTDHGSRQQLESELATLVSAIKERGEDSVATELGLGENITERMTETALFLNGYGSAPEDPFGSTPTQIKVAVQNDDLETAREKLEIYLSDWMPATGVFYLLYDDKLRLSDEIRAEPRYRKVFNTPRMQALADYRRARGLTAGLPIEN